MQLSVTGKQIDIGQALREHVETSLGASVDKYFGNAMEANVVFARDGNLIRAEIMVHVGKGILIQAQDAENDPYIAFDLAAAHMAKRLRRYKRRLRDHHRDSRQSDSLPAQQFILSGAAQMDGEDVIGNEPVVVAEMETEVPTLTVGEAVMRMDLANQTAMMFRNSAHGGLNMLYRRPDGHIGWIDPRGNRTRT